MTVIRFLNVQNNEKDTTETMNLVFNVTIDEGLDAGEYPVKVAAVAAKSTGDNTEAFIEKEKIKLDSGKITVVAPTHEHKWDDGVMTTMPTTTSNGVVTYTCTDTDCGETKTEDFVVGGAITENSAYTKIDLSRYKTQYAAKIEKQIFSDIVENGGTLVEYGMMFTDDGDIPVADGTSVQIGGIKSITTAPTGNKNVALSYTDANIYQMGCTLSFRPYIKFTYNGAVCYFYGAVYSKVFIDEVRGNTTDAQSVALAKLYDERNDENNATGSCTGTAVDTGNVNITDNAGYTLFDMNAAKVQYTAKIAKSVFSGIVENGGTLVEYGMMFTDDGDIPVADGTSVQIGGIKSITTAPTGNKNVALSYTDANITQMGYTLSFRPYIKYTNESGEISYEYGITKTFVLIDILRNYTETNTYVSNLVNYYDSYCKAE